MHALFTARTTHKDMLGTHCVWHFHKMMENKQKTFMHTHTHPHIHIQRKRDMHAYTQKGIEWQYAERNLKCKNPSNQGHSFAEKKGTTRRKNDSYSIYIERKGNPFNKMCLPAFLFITNKFQRNCLLLYSGFLPRTLYVHPSLSLCVTFSNAP